MPRTRASSNQPVRWKITLSEVTFGPEEREAIEEVLASGWVTMGPVTERFETELAKRLGSKHAVLVSSGTAGLHMALTSLGIGPGDEVILPSMAFVGLANTIRHTGAQPVFCDIESPTFPLIDLRDATSRLTPRTKALLVPAFAGLPPRMDEIMEFCRRHRVQLVEDASQALGASHHGHPLGTIGALGVYAFFPTHNIVAGEGGAVVTNNATLARRLRLLRSHGMTTTTWQRHNSRSLGYDVVALGHNYRPSDLLAALALAQLRKVDALNAARADAAAHYRNAFARDPRVEIPHGDPEAVASPVMMPILLPNSRLRDRVRQSLTDAGIQVSHHYPPVHTFSAYRAQYRTARLPNTEHFARRELTLPLHANLKAKQIDQVVQTVLAALKRA